MFQFTREFIINDNVGKINGKKFGTDGKTLFVDNMVNVRKKDINAIYKHAYEAEAIEAGKWAIVGLDATKDAGKLFRLVVTLGTQGKTTATFNDVYPDHSRQFFYETVATASNSTLTEADVLNGLVASYEHECTLPGHEKFLDMSVSGSNLVISALDCYTRIKEVRIVKLPVSDAQAHVDAVLTGYENYDVVIDWKRSEGADGTKCVEFTAGKEGNGNTVQILKNMRLQTWANINPYGSQMDERPLPKGKYDQYTIEMVTERRHIGHDVMGSVGTSLTTLVFYVLKVESSCEDVENPSAEFATVLEELWEKAPIGATPADEAHDGQIKKKVLAYTSELPDTEEEGSGSGSASAE